MTEAARNLPVGWHATTALLPHQREAVAKLLPSRVGALFAEMGTGKSRIAIELARLRQAKIDRVIWCCPVSAKETIRREVLKHTDATASDIHVFDDRTSDRALPSAYWIIVGTESISASNRVTLALRALVTERTLFVVDESHQIKGHRSRRTERLTLIARPARYRLILTGTPISQGIVDLFAQMRFLSPKILGYHSFYTFANNHLVYSERHRGLIEREKNAEYLAARIRPYVYQITKDECLDLPDKLYSARYCALTEFQRIAYDEAKERILLDEYLLGDDDQWQRQIAIFHLFTVLQTITCGFETNADGSIDTYPHHRLDLLREIIARIPDEPVVIWGKYRYAIDEIAAALRSDHGAKAVTIYHGGLRERERQANLDCWRTSGRFLIATQSAGGQSIDLTRARFVIYYANAFKYSERQQSEDRCHRIGQTRPVTYVDLWAGSGIDQRISRALDRKENAVQAFRQEVAKVRKTSKERLRELVKNL
jgi:SNF2 family DNA or RNA helicase